MLKKLFSHFGIYGLSPFIPGLVTVFVLRWITPHLTQEDFGIFGIITAYVGFFKVFYSLGLSVNLSNSFFKSRCQYKWLWRQIYGFWTLWSIVFAIFLIGVIYYIMPEEANENRWTIIGLNVLPIVFFGPTGVICNYYFQFKKMPYSVATRNVIFGLLNTGLVYYFIAEMKMGYMGWFWALFITGMVANISYWIPLNITYKLSPIFNFKWRTIKQALKVALPIIPHQNAMFLLNSSDRVVMDMMSIGTSQIGLYNAGYTATNYFNVIGQAVTNTIRPFTIEMIRDKKEVSLRHLFFFLQYSFFCMVIVFASLSKEIIGFLLNNPDFKDVYPLATLLVMSVMAKPMYLACISRLFYYEKTKSLAVYSFAAGIINVGLNILLIPIYGIEIAATTTIIGFLFLAYSRFWTKDYLDHEVLDYYPMRWLIASIGIVLLGYNLCTCSFSVRIIVCSITIALGIALIIRYNKLIKI